MATTKQPTHHYYLCSACGEYVALNANEVCTACEEGGACPPTHEMAHFAWAMRLNDTGDLGRRSYVYPLPGVRRRG